MNRKKKKKKETTRKVLCRYTKSDVFFSLLNFSLIPWHSSFTCLSANMFFGRLYLLDQLRPRSSSLGHTTRNSQNKDMVCFYSIPWEKATVGGRTFCCATLAFLSSNLYSLPLQSNHCPHLSIKPRLGIEPYVRSLLSIFVASATEHCNARSASRGTKREGKGRNAFSLCVCVCVCVCVRVRVCAWNMIGVFFG